ncbi:MAG: type II secretion system protein M [Chitinophagaceae bacterium]|nr:type II secretion system protein M [Polaromonas sp.]
MTFMNRLAPLRAYWSALGEREQTGLQMAAGLAGAAVLWWVLLAPALRTLRDAESQRRTWDAQLQKMQTMQSQARSLQSLPKLSRDDAARSLESSVKQRLGSSAQLNVVGDRATVTLRATPSDALAQWLAQARVNARAVPLEARLSRSTAAPAGKAVSAQAAWDGTLLMGLPAQ